MFIKNLRVFKRRIPYNFKILKEFETYKKVGKKRSQYKNYMQWKQYIYKEYVLNPCEHVANPVEYLINFKRYLLQNNRVAKSNEILNSVYTSLGILFITLAFSLITSIIDTPEMPANGRYLIIISQGILLLVLMVYMYFIYHRPIKINSLHICFTDDVMEIIDELLEQTHHIEKDLANDKS